MAVFHENCNHNKPLGSDQVQFDQRGQGNNERNQRDPPVSEKIREGEMGVSRAEWPARGGKQRRISRGKGQHDEKNQKFLSVVLGPTVGAIRGKDLQRGGNTGHGKILSREPKPLWGQESHLGEKEGGATRTWSEISETFSKTHFQKKETRLKEYPVRILLVTGINLLNSSETWVAVKDRSLSGGGN